MRLQSSHSLADRGDDFYPTPRPAIDALMRVEQLPQIIWEPAAGNGAIVEPLRAAGHTVYASDICEYGCGYDLFDYLDTPRPASVQGVVTNPPYRDAERFIRKAIAEVPFSAWLLRTNFLESVGRLSLFREHPPARVWVSSRRLPMMHRHGWEGPLASSNTCYAWFIWDVNASGTSIGWFDWREAATTEALS